MNVRYGYIQYILFLCVRARAAELNISTVQHILKYFNKLVLYVSD